MHQVLADAAALHGLRDDHHAQRGVTLPQSQRIAVPTTFNRARRRRLRRARANASPSAVRPLHLVRELPRPGVTVEPAQLHAVRQRRCRARRERNGKRSLDHGISEGTWRSRSCRRSSLRPTAVLGHSWRVPRHLPIQHKFVRTGSTSGRCAAARTQHLRHGAYLTMPVTDPHRIAVPQATTSRAAWCGAARTLEVRPSDARRAALDAADAAVVDEAVQDAHRAWRKTAWATGARVVRVLHRWAALIEAVARARRGGRGLDPPGARCVRATCRSPPKASASSPVR